LSTAQAPSPDSTDSMPSGSAIRHYVLVAAVYLLVTLPFLGGPPLFDPDEGYYPETAREMIERGNLLDPVFNSQPRWGKPIAFYLAETLSFKMFGMDERSARLPSVLAGLGFALLTMCAGARLFNIRTGFYAGLLTAVALQPVVYSRAAVPDMLLGVFVTLSLYAFLRCQGIGRQTASGQSIWWLLLAYASAGIAFLAKGPLGLILPGLTILAYLLFSGNAKGILKLKPITGILVFLLIAAPWYFYMYSLHGVSFLDEHFIQRNVNRYFTDKWQHPGSILYYIPVLIAGAFPWTVAFLGGLGTILRPKFRRERKLRKETLSDADIFLLCWFFVMFIFFSFSRSKLPNYVLPLYPAVMLVAARFILELENRRSDKLAHALVWITAGFTALLAMLGAWALAGKLEEDLATILLWFLPLAVIMASAPVFLFTHRLSHWVGVTAAGMVLFMAVITGFAIPEIDRLQAVKSLSLEHRHRFADTPGLAFWRVWHPSLLFYTGKQVLRFNPDLDDWETFRAKGIRWVLTRESALGEVEKLTGAPPAETYRMGNRVLLRIAAKDAFRGESGR
jgi:4-amino-4-deoxy-L-arabinose transferase-like glycosyltransferase